ncbi:YqcC family protein [Aliidiomarina celeris]|uniref:YqcC family protein n=1 Tax=Aliidiomarina celeris TaxID=2249428 RepID=UPI0018E5F9EC|nr:YqcC family protein [Aliidiomarina celeris]
MSVEKIAQLLQQIREQMQAQGLWDETPPSAEALQSKQPFAVDTLDFHQWLQFIMIPEFEHRIAQQMPLPHGFSISPMAEEAWRGKWAERRELILLLREFDALFAH